MTSSSPTSTASNPAAAREAASSGPRTPDSATRITSDGDRANVLVRLAGRDVLQDKAVRAKFLESAKGITSDGDYRRVIEALP